MSEKNLVWHKSSVTRAQREAAHQHKAVVVWFTGLPGSGKSTIAHGLEAQLFAEGREVYVLDGDNIRHGLCSDLGFTPEDRTENIRRVGEVAKLLYDAGMIVLCAFVSPTEAGREQVRRLLPENGFIEIYCHCPIDVIAERDPKGFYAQAKTGQIANYTGVSAPYEAPAHPDLALDTSAMTPEACIAQAVTLLQAREVLK